jgi:hypothetical protein
MKKQTIKVVTPDGKRQKLDDFIAQVATSALNRRQIPIMDIGKVHRAGMDAYAAHGGNVARIAEAVIARAIELSTVSQ